MISDQAITSLIMKKVQQIPDGCWIWPGALAGMGRVSSLHLHDEGQQRNINVRRWLWSQEYGFPPPMVQDRCALDERCVRPIHHPLRYDLDVLMRAITRVRDGMTIRDASREVQIPQILLSQLLTLDDWEAHRDASFWRYVDRTGEHWIWTVDWKNVPYEDGTIQAKHLAWLLSGRTLPSDMVLRVTCGERRCIHPEHQRPITARAWRLRNEQRGQAVHARNLRIVELVTVYRWTYEAVGALFQCSMSLVGQVVHAAGRRSPVRGRPKGARKVSRGGVGEA